MTLVVAHAFHHLQEEEHCLGAVLVKDLPEFRVSEHLVCFVDKVELCAFERMNMTHK
jgi:hypothetical protein